MRRTSRITRALLLRASVWMRWLESIIAVGPPRRRVLGLFDRGFDQFFGLRILNEFARTPFRGPVLRMAIATGSVAKRPSRTRKPGNRFIISNRVGLLPANTSAPPDFSISNAPASDPRSTTAFFSARVSKVSDLAFFRHGNSNPRPIHVSQSRDGRSARNEVAEFDFQVR